MLAPAHPRARKSAADLKAFHCIDAEHGRAQQGRQFVVDRLADACRQARDFAADHAAHGVARFADLVHEGEERFGHFGVGALGGLSGRGGVGEGLGGPPVGGQARAADFLHPGREGEVQLAGKDLFGHGSRNHAGDRFAGAGAAPAPPIAMTVVFYMVGIICVRRSERAGVLVVVAAFCIRVGHPKRERRARGVALKQAGKHLKIIRFPALGGDAAFAGAAAVHIRPDSLQVQRNPRRAAIHHHAHARAVRFAKGCETKQGAESVAHGAKVGKLPQRWQAGAGPPLAESNFLRVGVGCMGEIGVFRGYDAQNMDDRGMLAGSVWGWVGGAVWAGRRTCISCAWIGRIR